ncbi:MAG: Carbohydrate binding family 6 [Candidatus Shapirobacteria bacterium GW2011_GWF1_38_23]|nr:MAG: Carbohydrate binding family 6 [Candidatus Shapirobacteria bacterium GW2011_GWF1_38_23]
MIFLILLFFVFCPKTAFAAPEITIINFPQTVIVGDTFSLDFNVSSLDNGLTYHFKAVGDSNTDISIFPACASRYDDCLNLIISDPATNSATATLKINLAQTLNNIKIRLAQSDKHASTYDSQYVSIASIIATPSATLTPTIIISPTATPSSVPTIIPTTIPTVVPTATPTASSSATLKNYLILNEIFANPESGNTNIGATSFYSHSFSSGFLNNGGDTVHFLDTIVTYPSSPKNSSYSLQENNSWCFTSPSQNLFNNNCQSSTPTPTSSPSSNSNTSPVLDLQSTLSPVFPGQKFNLTFRLNSSEPYSLRLNSPFGNRYSAFGDFHDGFSYLNMELTVPKTLATGTHLLHFHLKKDTSSKLIDFEPGDLIVKSAPAKVTTVPKKVSIPKSQVLGLSTFSSSLSSTPASCSSVTTLNSVSPDTNFFSWPFLFGGSILFLSPILFPKLYPA